MDEAVKTSCIKKLEQLVYDDDKLVTCIQLARDLKISLQNAKELLTSFVENHSQRIRDDFGLSCTYILSGVLNDNSSCVCVVKDHEKDEKKSLFLKVDNEFIYSIQKSNDIDYNIIALCEKLDVSENSHEEPLPGSIVSKNCFKRKFKPKKLPPVQEKQIKQKPSFFTKIEPKQDSVNDRKVTQQADGKSKQETKGKSKASIANFFSKGNQNKTNERPNGQNISKKPAKADSEEIKIEAKTTPSKKVSPQKSSPTKKAKNESPKLEIKDEKMEIDEVSIGDSSISSSPKKKNATSSGKRSKKRPNKENDQQSSKRRKRIIERNDSDSDDIFEKDEPCQDDVLEKSFEEEPEVANNSLQKQPLGQKNKKRKAIDRTYEDEDGFIVTRTEYVYVTDSEDEIELIKEVPVPTPPVKVEQKSPISKPEVPANTKAAPKGGKKGKKASNTNNQPSIMNFFKKK